MIQITDKENCCGCSACVQVCPKQCISFDEDEQGFGYPKVDKKTCIDCRLCEKVCPYLNSVETRVPLNIFAAINNNENVRMQSSSGGIFSLLAENVIKAGGVVFGARFDEGWNIVHAFTEKIEGIPAFRGSKYVQSRIGDSFRKVREFLEDGREVLFSGTPCQIEGLKRYLCKKYDNLLTIEVVCHGVPSPFVWKKYLEYVSKVSGKALSEIESISFRDKTHGWRKFSLVIQGKSSEIIVHETLEENLFLQTFLHNLSLRPSCFQCPSRKGRSGADISLGDFWRIWESMPEKNDNKGTSLILGYTTKGISAIKKTGVVLTHVDYETALLSNSSIEQSVKTPANYARFWKDISRKGLSPALKYCYQTVMSMKQRVILTAYTFKQKLLGKS